MYTKKEFNNIDLKDTRFRAENCDGEVKDCRLYATNCVIIGDGNKIINPPCDKCGK